MALAIYLNLVIYSTKSDCQACYQIIVMTSTQRMQNAQNYNYHECLYKYFRIIRNIFLFYLIHSVKI